MALTSLTGVGILKGSLPTLKNNLTIGSSYAGRKKTLDELEKDEQFLEVSERFLQSVGENSDDVFEYLRDSDFNLYSGMRRAAQSANFTDQQKQDYNYLRKEFDNADLGSMKQFFGLVKDAAIDITTDPTAITAALLTPVTGGASLAARQGVATAGLQVAKNFVGPTIPKSIIAGQLKKEGKEAVKKAALVTGAEVGAWTGLDNHFRQTTELNTGIRKLYSTPELAGTAALGTLTGGLLGGALQKGNLFYSKMNRLYSEDGYLTLEPGSFQDKVSKTLEAGDILKANTIGSATSILDTKAKFSPITRELGNLMREDFSRGFGGLTRERVALGHGELLENLRGEYHSVFDEATAPLRKAGAFKEADELGVIRILRGDKPEGYSEDVQQVAKDLRGFFNKIFDDAIEAGLIKEERKLPNYFTRSWDRKAIEENRETFTDLLISENVVKDKADASDLINDMLNKNNELFSSHSILLTQSRAFQDLNDNAFEKFLTNDLNTVVTYYMNAANAIQHKKSFLLPGFSTKSNANQFAARWLDPMDRELREARGGRGLSRGDRKRITKLYESITGQVNYFDSQRIQGAYDTMKLANSLAYLPLATVSSLTEAMIPLTKTSGSVTKPIQDALSGVKEGHKIFVQDIPILLRKKYDMPDSQIQKEMNQVFMAMDESLAESTNRLTGEGLQNEWLKKQARGFFRLNLLTPWTKSVQLASFNIAKNLIKENLEKLNKLSKEGVDIFNETATKELSRKEVRNIQLLKSEVFDLGIDIDDGLRWLNSGAKTGFGAERKDGVLTGQLKYEDDFYKSVLQGAGRFVNEVIMPVGRDRARIPIFMTNPKVDILTQFLRYPTVFSNTVLKNYIRSAVNNPTVNGAKLGAFALMATSLALGTNYWRSNEDNRDRIVEEGFEDEDFIKAFQRVGLFGPLEYGLRFKNSIQYTKNPAVSVLSLGGPTVTDTLGLLLGRKGLVETAAGKTPFIGTKGLMNKYIGANPYDDLNIFAKEIDKEAAYALGIKDRPKDRKYTRNYTDFYRSNYVTGGIVEGENKVPYTKENPADRINPYTGEPYQEQMDRLGFDNGGEASGPPKFEKRIARPDPKMFIRDPESGNPQTHRMAWGDIEGQFIAYPTIIEQDGKLVQYDNNTETMKLMKKSGNFKAFDTKEEAEAYADGGWKTDKFNKAYRKEFAFGGLGKLVGKEIVENISKPKPRYSATELDILPLPYSQKKILEDESFKGIEAMHGTPSDFDKFSTEFLMSGEGAMAFGKGLYFTTTEEIAKGYKKNISKSQGIKKLNEEYQDLLDQAEKAKKAGNNKEKQAFLLKAIDKDKELETFKTTPLPDNVGNLYKVNLKTTDKHLLDWDAKMSNQSGGVVSAAETAVERLDNRQLTEFIDLYSRYPSWTKDSIDIDREQLVSDAWVTMGDLTGEDFISSINKLLNKGNTSDKKYVEDILEKSGVMGIKYNDGFTRKRKGKKNKNYVIFDARIIEISKKYGIAIPAAAALLKKVDDEARSGNVSSDEQMDRLGLNQGTIFGTIKDTLEKASRVASDTVDKLKTERQEPSPEDTQRVNNFLAKHYDRFKTQYPEMSDVSFEQFKDSAQRLAANVRKIESNNRNAPLGSNLLGSSATGKYQFLRDSVEPAINRTLRRLDPKDKNIFDGIRESKDTSKLNDEAQQLLFYGDIFEKKGSDKHLIPYFLGDEQAGKNVYLYQHHTLASKVPEYNQATIDRTNKLWNSPE